MGTRDGGRGMGLSISHPSPLPRPPSPEVDNSLRYRILAFAYRTPDDSRPYHPAEHFAGREHQHVELVRLGAAQHLS